MAEENKALKRRTGELLIELTDVRNELYELKHSTAHIPKEGKLQSKFNAFGLPARPQTASTRKKETNLLGSESNPKTVDQELDDIDSELAELMQRNQNRLQELHSDFKEVSKMNDEPYVNVRKVKGPIKKPQANAAAAADQEEEV